MDISASLENIMLALAKKLTRGMPSGERNEVIDDLMQTMRLAAVEVDKRYRGDNDATFSSYAYFPVVCAARLALKNYKSPVTSGKNNPAGWSARRTTTDAAALEARADESTQADTLIATRRAHAHLHQLARRHAHHEAIEAVVFEEESYESVSTRTGLPIPQLRRAVSDFRHDAAKDPTLRALYASR